MTLRLKNVLANISGWSSFTDTGEAVDRRVEEGEHGERAESGGAQDRLGIARRVGSQARRRG